MSYGDCVDAEINLHGSEVTLRSVSRTYSDYGDETNTNVDETIKVILNSLNAEDEAVKEGIVRTGDYRFFCLSDQTGLVTGAKIVHRDVVYLIIEVLPHEIDGAIVGYEVLTRKE